MGYSMLFGMENSCWRVSKKSLAVRRSPSEPARWGLVAYLRDATVALAEFGIVLEESDQSGRHRRIRGLTERNSQPRESWRAHALWEQRRLSPTGKDRVWMRITICGGYTTKTRGKARI